MATPTTPSTTPAETASTASVPMAQLPDARFSVGPWARAPGAASHAEEGIRRSVTKEDVHAAADQLLMAGERPSIEKTRKLLGRGSPNTIGPLLNGWFAQLHERIVSPETFVARAGVPETLTALVQPLWEAARRLADEQALASLSSQRAAHEASLAQLASDQEALEAKRRELHVQWEAFEQSKETMQRQLAEGARAQDELLGLIRKREVELDEAHQELVLQVTERDDARRALEHEKRLRTEDQARAERELQALRAETSEARTRLQGQLEAAQAMAQERETRSKAVERELALQRSAADTERRTLTTKLAERDAKLGEQDLLLAQSRAQVAQAQAQQRTIEAQDADRRADAKRRETELVTRLDATQRELQRLLDQAEQRDKSMSTMLAQVQATTENWAQVVREAKQGPDGSGKARS